MYAIIDNNEEHCLKLFDKSRKKQVTASAPSNDFNGKASKN